MVDFPAHQLTMGDSTISNQSPPWNEPMRSRNWQHLIILLAVLSQSVTQMAAAEQTFTLSEQTTTVRDREEPLQWTPYAVTVIKKDDLEQTHNRTLEDLEGIAPGVIIDTLSGTPEGAAISIRGIGSSEVSNGFSPAVAVSVDGVYVGTHASQMQVLFDFEQIEITRGPAVTYQSAPNIAGTISLTRTRPTGKLGAKVRSSIGENGGKQLDTVINFPVVDGLAGKVSFHWKDGGGDYMKNIVNGRGENNKDRLALSTSFLWQVSDDVSVQYTYDNESDDSDTPALLNISRQTDLLCSSSIDNANCGSTIGPNEPQTNSFDKTAQNFSNKRSYDGQYHTVKADFDWREYKITSITGLRSNQESMAQDLDSTQSDFYSIALDQDYDQFSQEVRLSGEYSTDLRYLAGFSYMKTENKLDQEEFYIRKALSDANLGPGAGVNEVQQLSSREKSELTSTFAHVEYTLDDQWSADAGARYSYLEKKIHHSPLGIRVNDIVLPSPVILIAKDEWDDWSWSAGIQFKVDDQAMIYGRYSEGFRPAGYNQNAVSLQSITPYGAETTDNWEIGMKSEWYNDHLRLNMAYYQVDQDTKTEQFIAEVSPGQLESIVDNVAHIESVGYELELEAVPFDNLFLRGSYNHVNSDYKDYNIPDLQNPGEVLDLTTLTPNWAPSDMIYLSARYSFDFYSGVINTFAGYRYTNDYQTNPLIASSNVNNATNWDLSIDYIWQEWTFRLFSKNFNNSRHLQNVVTINDGDIGPISPTATGATGLVTYAEYNQPRYTGLEVIYQPDLSKYF